MRKTTYDQDGNILSVYAIDENGNTVGEALINNTVTVTENASQEASAVSDTTEDTSSDTSGEESEEDNTETTFTQTIGGYTFTGEYANNSASFTQKQGNTVRSLNFSSDTQETAVENSTDTESTTTNSVSASYNNTGEVRELYTSSTHYDTKGNPVTDAFTNKIKNTSDTFTAVYDSKDRLTSLTNADSSKKAVYTYDCDGRIIRENNKIGNYTADFRYDKRGNLTERDRYDYTEEDTDNAVQDVYRSLDINYSEDDLWVDSMTHIESYGDSMDVTTDINGNTINFLNDGNVLLEFEWTNGRQLKALYFVDGETGERVCFAYNTYDENGMRTSKTYDGVTTYYNYQGDKLLSQYNQEEDGTVDDVIFFLYDGDDNIIGMNFDGEFYYYQKNVLGDVTAVYDSNGVCVAEYEYDAWGNCIKQTGGERSNLAIDSINPIRYRSYYYENSVGMYYLQSRYYYAEAGRFINADDPQIALDSKEDTDGTNLFAYCCNDPVNNVDYGGHKSVSDKMRKSLIKRYKNLLSKKGYAYIYKDSSNNHYDVTKDSDGIYSISSEHRFDGGKKYYNGVYLYGSAKAWNNVYQDYQREKKNMEGFVSALSELASLNFYVLYVVVLISCFVLALKYSVIETELEHARAMAKAAKKKGYYEYIQTLSKTTIKKNKMETTYLIG